MSKPDPTRLAWLDLETTGLDKHRDVIIEVALIITDMDLHELSRFTAPVRGDNWLHLIERDSFINEMHTKNGLKAELVDGLGFSYRQISRKLVTILAQYGQPGEYLIAGSGVAAFDQPWINLHWPDVAAFWQYSPLDIGSLRRFVKYVLRKPELINEGTEQHRALPDIEEFLWQTRHLRNKMSEL